MEKIALPSKITVEPGTKPNESIISIQPCHPGFGTTLGNALRRILLSSLTGGAITAFKAKGATHEFTSLPDVLEDIVDISLNLKQIRMRVHSDQPVELTLKAKGDKKVTSGDIAPNSAVEIVNPDAMIATLTSKTAELEMKLIVAQGRGYVPTENREGEALEVGMIAVDAIFSPVQNVGFRIENVRVGQMTNYENLILNIETDGSRTASESLEEATKILIDHFNFIEENVNGSSDNQPTEAEASEESQDAKNDEGEKDDAGEKIEKKKGKK